MIYKYLILYCDHRVSPYKHIMYKKTDFLLHPPTILSHTFRPHIENWIVLHFILLFSMKNFKFFRTKHRILFWKKHFWWFQKFLRIVIHAYLGDVFKFYWTSSRKTVLLNPPAVISYFFIKPRFFFPSWSNSFQWSSHSLYSIPLNVLHRFNTPCTWKVSLFWNTLYQKSLFVPAKCSKKIQFYRSRCKFYHFSHPC